MSYTKGERYVTCSDEWWFTEITNPDSTQPNIVVGRFRHKEDALLDAAAPEMYAALKLLMERFESMEKKYSYPMSLDLPRIWAERALAKAGRYD